MDESIRPGMPTVTHALHAITQTAINQARDIVVAQLECWSERLRLQLAAADAEPDDNSTPQDNAASSSIAMLVGAMTGVTVALLVARQAGKI